MPSAVAVRLTSASSTLNFNALRAHITPHLPTQGHRNYPKQMPSIETKRVIRATDEAWWRRHCQALVEYSQDKSKLSRSLARGKVSLALMRLELRFSPFLLLFVAPNQPRDEICALLFRSRALKFGNPYCVVLRFALFFSPEHEKLSTSHLRGKQVEKRKRRRVANTS